MGNEWMNYMAILEMCFHNDDKTSKQYAFTISKKCHVLTPNQLNAAAWSVALKDSNYDALVSVLNLHDSVVKLAIINMQCLLRLSK